MAVSVELRTWNDAIGVLSDHGFLSCSTEYRHIPSIFNRSDGISKFSYVDKIVEWQFRLLGGSKPDITSSQPRFCRSVDDIFRHCLIQRFSTFSIGSISQFTMKMARKKLWEHSFFVEQTPKRHFLSLFSVL